MTRNLKVFGLALVAMLSMAAMASSAAQATNFTAESYPVTLTGNQATNHVFSAGGGTVTCTTASFHGLSGAGPSETQTITPTYTNCTAFGFIEAKVTGFGHYGESKKCDYLFRTNGLVDLTCESGATGVVVDGPCNITIEPQDNISKVTYTNQGSGTTRDVLVTAEATNIKLTIDHSFACTLAGISPLNTTISNGTYTGTTTLKAEKVGTNTHVGVDVG